MWSGMQKYDTHLQTSISTQSDLIVFVSCATDLFISLLSIHSGNRSVHRYSRDSEGSMRMEVEKPSHARSAMVWTCSELWRDRLQWICHLCKEIPPLVFYMVSLHIQDVYCLCEAFTCHKNCFDSSMTEHPGESLHVLDNHNNMPAEAGI